MAGEPIEEWRQPSPAPSDDGSSSSDESTSYKEEVLTLRPEKNVVWRKKIIRPILRRRILQQDNLAPQLRSKQLMRTALVNN